MAVIELDSLLEDLEGSVCHSQRSDQSREKNINMTTAALGNNINELDLLLQDLSAARYNGGPIEKRETVTETRTYTSHTNGYLDQDSPPKPPERSKTQHQESGKFSLNGDHHQLHSVERSRTDDVQTTMHAGAPGSGVPDQIGGGLDSKWEYMGFGIWESKDGERREGSVTPPQQLSMRPDLSNFNTSTTTSTMKTTKSSSGGFLDDSHFGASTATAELDDLMTSLNDFKMESERNVDEPVISGAPNLDDMLGNLQEDMDKQGIKTKQKGVCVACSKPIVGQVITALGHTWHPEHFTCSHCNQELGTMNFFERDGKPYCEQDYHHLFSPRCGYCNGPILDKCISALDQTFHPEHFFCASCSRQFGDEGFHEKEDSAFCKDCYFEQFAPKCGGCNLPITENYISSLNLQWHPNCFVCKECQSPFNDGAFFEHEGFPYCETHYHALRGSLCAGCHKAISGRCITAMFRKFHPEHFVCSFCLKQLNKGTFKEQGDKPYCHDCFERLFG